MDEKGKQEKRERFFSQEGKKAERFKGIGP